MKQVWIWVWTSSFPQLAGQVHGDLYFSSKEKFLELLERPMIDGEEALIKIWVDKDFDDMDYIPENY